MVSTAGAAIISMIEWTLLVRYARSSAMMRLSKLVGTLTFLALLGLGYRGVAADIAATASGDPFAYCAHVGTTDGPAGGASPVPIALGLALRRTLGLSADVPFKPEHYYWRCMDGKVYVCAIGANRRCDLKADRSSRNSGADSFCRENRNAASVPAYATGHNTIYEWSCSAGSAVAGKHTMKVDHRGYRADNWYRVSNQ